MSGRCLKSWAQRRGGGGQSAEPVGPSYHAPLARWGRGACKTLRHSLCLSLMWEVEADSAIRDTLAAPISDPSPNKNNDLMTLYDLPLYFVYVFGGVKATIPAKSRSSTLLFHPGRVGP